MASIVKWFVTPRHDGALWLFLAAALGVGVIAFLGMRATPPRYRKAIVAVVTFLAGLFYVVEFFWRGSGPNEDNPLSAGVQPVGEAVLVIGSFTLLLGVVNLVMIHAKAIRQWRPGRQNSAAFFIAMGAILAAGMIPFIRSEMRGSRASESALYEILFDGLLVPMGATMFSLVAFYIVSASYRAFRTKSGEATLMMVAAFIVMLGMVPIGVFLTHNLPLTGFWSVFRLENLTQWILTWPNAAAQRAISLGIAVGALAMAIRIWFSLERGSFFDKQ